MTDRTYHADKPLDRSCLFRYYSFIG